MNESIQSNDVELTIKDYAARARKNYEIRRQLEIDGEFWRQMGDFYASHKADQQSQSSNGQDEVDGTEKEVQPSILYELQKLSSVEAEEGIQVCSALGLNAKDIWIMEQGIVGMNSMI